MSDQRKRPRVTTSGDTSGFDVWLPAIVAIIAAIFMLTAAHADEPVAAPRAIYDAARFDADAITRESEAAAASASAEAGAAAHSRHVTVGTVIVAALPDLSQATPADVVAPVDTAVRPAVDRSVVIGAGDDHGPSLGRAIAASVIAALLLMALIALTRTWRRIAPIAV